MFSLLTKVGGLADGTHAEGLAGQKWIVRKSIRIQRTRMSLTPDEGNVFLVCPETADIHEVAGDEMLCVKQTKEQILAIIGDDDEPFVDPPVELGVGIDPGPDSIHHTRPPGGHK